MEEAADPDASIRSAMREYRKLYKTQCDELLQMLKQRKLGDRTLLDMIVCAPAVNMTDIGGTDQEVAAAIDRFYTSDGQ